MKSGIYKITSLKHQKSYIGSSLNILKRKESHYYLLSINKHGNKHLQHIYNKYGEDNLLFEIICYCDNKYLLQLEQWFIDNDNSELNIVKIVESPLIGIEKSEDCKNKISNSLSKEIYQYDLEGNFIKSWKNALQASKELNINAGNITSCCKRRYKKAGNYIWRYSNDTNLNLSTIKDSKTKKVALKTLDNSLVKEFGSIVECANYLGVVRSCVTNCCRGVLKSIKKQYKTEYI